MPGTLVASDSTWAVEVDGGGGGEQETEERNGGNQQQQQQQNNLQNMNRRSSYYNLFDETNNTNNNTATTFRQPDFVREMFNLNESQNNLLWEVQQQLQQQIISDRQNQQQHRGSIVTVGSPRKVHSFVSNTSSSNQNQQQIISPPINRNNNNPNVPANVVIDPRSKMNDPHSNNNNNFTHNFETTLPKIVDKKAQTARNYLPNEVSPSKNAHQLFGNDGGAGNTFSPSSFHPTLFKRQSPTMKFSPSPPKQQHQQQQQSSSPNQNPHRLSLGGAFAAGLIISGLKNQQQQQRDVK